MGRQPGCTHAPVLHTLSVPGARLELVIMRLLRRSTEGGHPASKHKPGAALTFPSVLMAAVCISSSADRCRHLTERRHLRGGGGCR